MMEFFCELLSLSALDKPSALFFYLEEIPDFSREFYSRDGKRKEEI
jgi:hypothetical protein